MLLRFVISIEIVMLCGCTTLPARNEPLTERAGGSGYRLSNTPAGPLNSDSLFVILAFSGGGSRAAAFSYGALEKLRDTEIVWEGERCRLLDEVDVISSVSGGSIPAAYYTLFGDRIFDDFSGKVLLRNFRGDLIRKGLSPIIMWKLIFQGFGRTDILAEMFTEEVFEGKTFENLLEQNERPFLIINATDLALGSRFEFTQQQFDLLNSDLGQYPIGYAVAASSAYPGILTPVTLKNYPKGDDFEPPAWIAEEEHRDDPSRIRYPLYRNCKSYLEPGSPFVHLVDGGISDNLGILPVIQFAGETYSNDSIQIDAGQIAIKKFVIILVNAKQPATPQYNRRNNIVNLFRVLVDAGQRPMSNFSALETAYLRTYIRTLTEKQRIRDEIAKTNKEEDIQRHLPELGVQNTDYYFVEVGFDGIGNEQEMNYLNRIPSALRLEQEQVDRLRGAAETILDTNPDFQKLLGDLK